MTQKDDKEKKLVTFRSKCIISDGMPGIFDATHKTCPVLQKKAKELHQKWTRLQAKRKRKRRRRWGLEQIPILVFLGTCVRYI